MSASGTLHLETAVRANTEGALVNATEERAEIPLPIEQKIAHIWSDVLRVGDIGPEENFFDLGGHSLLAVRVMARIRSTCGVDIPLNLLLEKPTLGEFSRAVAGVIEKPKEAAAEELAGHRLVPIQPEGTQPPLFWIPGGRAVSAIAFRETSLQLGDDQPAFGVESNLPGQGEQFASVEDRAAQYLQLIRSRQPHGPYRLAGFCLGGMVAYEMAQQLQDQGEDVEFLGLMQASTPQFLRSRWKRRRMFNQRRMYFLKTFGAFLWMRIAPGPMAPARERKQQVLDRVAKLLLGWVGTSAQIPEDTQTSNVDTMKRYVPRRYKGDIDLFLAEDCYESAGVKPPLDPRLGWRELADGQCRVHFAAGDHSTMLAGAQAKALAGTLTECLRRG